MIYQRVYLKDFIKLMREKTNRFSFEALEALYDHYNGVTTELDEEAIIEQFCELTEAEFKEYSIEEKEAFYLENGNILVKNY